ncbi:2,3-bisphosphoglycerate-dependent phosphoglycerate mutase [Candidatus Scalindua japonica]|uniref:2,3-bisphosphoglycerate-dependent phosphoglycerate mutase n=1 Tax=Candidatus Scalindua japonica TaxID=1284222 RepID=A0A286TXM6_9BACT|nr:PilZ domain-containing protein [Candidatus Scalindua japonica]GAX60627.1 2,3-bisphosphoglycerate-dependent phosphoglycerate mutase [Candidatus Scalindua japonica]
MLSKVIYPNRRRRQRINGEFEVSFPDQIKGRTKNVSAHGASFEVITDNPDTFSPGAVITLEIATPNTTLDSKMRKLRLSGKGVIISREVIEKTTGCRVKLNIAVQFKEKLNFWVPSNN